MEIELPKKVTLLNGMNKKMRLLVYIFLPLVAFWGLLVGSFLISAQSPQLRMISWRLVRPVGLLALLLVIMNWEKTVFIKPFMAMVVIVLIIGIGLSLSLSFIPDSVSNILMPQSKSLIDLIEFYHLELDYVSWIYYVVIAVKVISIAIEELYYRGFAYAEFFQESKLKFWIISLMGSLFIHPWSHELIVCLLTSAVAAKIMIRTNNVFYCIIFRCAFHSTSLVLLFLRS